MQAREAGSSKKNPAKGGPPLGARDAVKTPGEARIWMFVWETTPASEGLEVLEGGMVTVFWPEAVFAQHEITTAAVTREIVVRLVRIGTYLRVTIVFDSPEVNRKC